ncbi:MAG TPA: carboxypeptidase-like regulatory domain-containing protein [Acidobacteriaceae bacterium]|nr:carboxypeptidase-like regulatory domain-containing protein [Acidobacteriaceae bacterium]
MKDWKKTRTLFWRACSFVVRASCLAGLIVAVGASRPVYAQDNTDRSVQGRVVDDQDTPLRSAIVYLSDQRTKTVESYITQEDGAYRFQQLSPNDDYKLWAQLEGAKSKTKILSSFDGRSVFRVILKISPKK